MLQSPDFALLKIRRIIFHDVPSSRKDEKKAPTLANALTPTDPERDKILKQRLTRALNSKSAYPVQFLSATSSTVPVEVTNFCAKSRNKNEFIEMTRRLAEFLCDQQGGTISPGLLCVLEIVSDSRRGIALMKLERERGAELEMTEKGGKRSFEMSVLDNLVLTDGTRLFKSALFLRSSKEKILAVVCDSQRATTSSDEMARFWLRFLGCGVTIEPRVATQQWFDATIQFVNEYITDPVEKNDVYEHVFSELKSNKPELLPKEFIENYVPEDFRTDYKSFLKEKNVPQTKFVKDLSDIKSRVSRRLFRTNRGVTVSSPADEEGLIQIESEQIVVHDALKSVSNQ